MESIVQKSSIQSADVFNNGSYSLIESYGLDKVVRSKAYFDETKDWASILKANPFKISEVPCGCQTEEMIIAALCESGKSWRNFIGLDSRCISKRFKTPEFAKKIIELEPCNILHLPPSLATPSLGRFALALSGGGDGLALLSESDLKTLTREEISNCISNSTGLGFLRIPSSCEARNDPEFGEQARKARESYSDAVRKAHQNQITHEATSIQGFDGIEELLIPTAITYCEPSSRQSSSQLACSAKTKTLATRHSPHIYIYYVFDLHLEWQIKDIGPIKVSSSFELDNLVKPVVKNILSGLLPLERCFLFIGGDVADSPALIDSFYRVLFRTLRRMYLRCNVIAIMGNHELRHLTEEQFRDMLEPYGFYAATDVLFLRYKGARNILLDAKDVLRADDEELSRIIGDSEIAILAGTGYAGRNTAFNANAGLYESGVTRGEEISRSKRFDDFLMKVSEASSLPLHILSHNPPEDWHDSAKPLPAGAYFSGHTHRNRRLTSKACSFLQDAQIGKETDPRRIRACCYNTALLKYEPFKSLGEGIHHISRDDYIIYANMHGSQGCSDCSYPGEFYLVRRAGYSIFFLKQEKGLLLLELGQRSKAKGAHDLGYYYENLPAFANAIVRILGTYPSKKEQVGALFRQAGGSGNSHGCIIDFDFVHHAFLNPNDGSLHCYWASSTKTRRYFADFTEMAKHAESKAPRDICAKLDAMCTIRHKTGEMCVGEDFSRLSRFVLRMDRIRESGLVTMWEDSILQGNYAKDAYAIATNPEEGAEQAFLPPVRIPSTTKVCFPASKDHVEPVQSIKPKTPGFLSWLKERLPWRQ